MYRLINVFTFTALEVRHLKVGRSAGSSGEASAPRQAFDEIRTSSGKSSAATDLIANRPATLRRHRRTAQYRKCTFYESDPRAERAAHDFDSSFPAADPYNTPGATFTNLQPHRWLPQRSMSRSSRSALRSSSVTRVTASTALARAGGSPRVSTTA